jgi:hypothetical protein
MSTTGTVTPATATGSRRHALVAWLVWTTSFLAFPVAGVVGIAVVGRVDGPVAAVLGGLATGAVIGLGQSIASSRRLAAARWTAATSLGIGAGLLLGSQTVGYGTSMGDLALMGALTGAVLGPAQAAALPRGTARAWVWALAMPVLWAVGWVVTTAAGIDVEEQFTSFGISGAVTATAILGIILQLLLPVSPKRPSPLAHSTMTGAPS